MSLEFAQTQELISELLNRYDHAIFAGYKVLKENPAGVGDSEIHRRWVGNKTTCVGLASNLSHHLNSLILEDSNELR